MKAAGVVEVEMQPKAEQTDLVPADPQSQMLQMMERLATNKDVDVVKLQALIDMQKDILQVNAKAAFNAAFAKLQQQLPTVIEKGKTNNGQYARLEDIIETVRPILGAHGFSLSHRTEWPDAKTVKVIGILTHEQGYSRESEFLGAADKSGNKNEIQALGSSVSYGRRYTTKDLLNIVTKGEDDDGKKSSAPAEPDGQVEWIDAAGKRQVGYAQWIDLMDAFVLEGATRKHLDEKWYAAPEAFRKYIATVDRSHVEGWKKKADQSTKGGK